VAVEEMLATTKQPEHNFNSEDYYEVLGVDRKATIKEIVAAYRNLVNKKHPDKQYGDTDAFRLIQEAFNVLRDPVRRKKYNEHGRLTGDEIQDTRDYIMSVVEQVVNDENVDLALVDMVETLRKTTVQNLAGANGELKKNQKRKKRIEKNQHRTKDEAILRVFRKHKGVATQQIEKLEQAIHMFKVALIILEDYEYEFEVPPPAPEVFPPGHIVWTTK
jgi:DnaJ-class molecular chaperone